jgi:PAS domain S-box-containing protein
MKRSLLLRYGVAVLAVGVVLLVKLLLNPLITEQAPFLLLAAAVMVGAWFGGLGPGLLATALATLVADYFFLPPVGSFTSLDVAFLPLALFAVQGLVISSLTQALHSAGQRAEASALEAESHQESLRQSEERFRALVQNSSDVITVIDADGTIRYVSPAVERVMDHRPEELVGKSVFDYVRPNVLADAQKIFAEAWSRPGVHPPFEFEVRHKDGSWRRAEFLLNNLLDDPSVRGVVVNQRDVTERRRAEEAHREAEARYRALVEQIPAITYIEAVDQGERSTNLVYVSPQIEAMFGYSPEEWIADPDLFVKLLHPDDRERVLTEDARTDKTGDPFGMEYRQFAKDGRVLWVRDASVLVHDEGGKPLYWLGVLFDITERKEAEKLLLESEELYRTVVEQTAENIFLVDVETKNFIQANASFQRSLGYELEELHRLTLYDIVAHAPETIDRNIRRILEEGRSYVGERQYRRKDGSLIDVEANGGAISYGGRPALCVVAHDITDRKRTERALRRSLDGLLALYETGQVLSSSLDREEIGSSLLEIMGRISGTTAAVISLHDGGEGLLTWRTVGSESILASVRDEPEARAARRAAFEAEVERLVEMKRPGLQAERLAGLFLPLRVRNRVIGVLEVYGPEHLAESDTPETFASLANQAASALENARLYEELSEREQQLHDLVRRLLTAQEEERRRVAYDLHDGLAQTAAAAYQHLQIFVRRHAPGSAPAREELEEALELLRQTVGETRQVISDLRPTVLDDFGLAAAVRLQVETLRSEGLNVGYKEALGGQRLPTEVETTLFRVAQEALTNVRKHARASWAHVSLEREGETIRLVIRDEGGGFRPDDAENGGAPGERVGLSSMRERVSLLGGRFEIHSEPGNGTSIMVEVRLLEPEEDADRA